MGDLQVLAGLVKGCIVKLPTIIDDDHSRQAESIDGHPSQTASFLLHDMV